MIDLRTAAQQALEALDAYSWEQVDEARTALRAALAEPVQEQDTDCHAQGICQRSGYSLQLQRKPLTEEEIKQLLFESAGMTVTFSAVDLSLARAIEQAHGIV